MATDYSYRPKKICNHCKKEISYFISKEGGKKFICPLCKKEVDISKCIVFRGEINYGSNIIGKEVSIKFNK